MLNPDIMHEATRLTRAGKLVEATALIQHLLRGAITPGMPFGTTGDDMARAEPGPPTIEARVEVCPPLLSGPSSAEPLIAAGSSDRAKRRSGGPERRDITQRTPRSTPDILPQGARFIEGIYRNSAGGRAYKLYIPSRHQRQQLPLIVMLHGCAQSPDDFAAGTRMNEVAEEHDCLVVYPAQHRQANPAKCWNWFRPADQKRGRGEPSIIAGITRQIMRDHPVDPQRVYVGGLSAGAAAAMVMGMAYPDLYAAIGVHSGLDPGAAVDLPSALAAMRQGVLATTSEPGDRSASFADGSAIPIIVFHGDRDITVHPDNGDLIVERSLRTAPRRKQVHRGQVRGGHAYTRTIHRDANGDAIVEHWNIHGAGHAWSGGSSAGSYTDPRGPDATREMLRFFLEHTLPQQRCER